MGQTIRSGSRVQALEQLQIRAGHAVQHLASLGCGQDDCIATMLRNDFPVFEVGSAAAQLDAVTVPINWHSTGEEISYILTNCDAGVLVAHADLYREVAAYIPDNVVPVIVPTPPEIADAYQVGPEQVLVPEGVENWDKALALHPPGNIPAAVKPGMTMYYTSGTTGRPKGVRRIQRPSDDDTGAATQNMLGAIFGFDNDPMVALITGPMYHSAPQSHAVMTLAHGGSLVLQPKFDAEQFLYLVQRFRITHVHLVPTMFIRLLKLPLATRERYDISSLRSVTHGAAPCPRDIKLDMIDWWGPIIGEYYGSTETAAVTFNSSLDYVARPGTVGKPLDGAIVKVLGPDGIELPAGEVGEIYARNTTVSDFTYHKDPDKRQASDRDGLISVGDVGYLDEDGYLFLTDRKNDMIISGGVNIYPAQIEDALHSCPGVRDCAVFGIPDEEFGEKVCAIVEPETSGRQDRDEIVSHLRDRVSGYMVPRHIEFRSDLPREDSGKIYKRKLRDEFWRDTGRSI